MTSERAFRERDRALLRGDDPEPSLDQMKRSYEAFSRMDDDEQEQFLLELNQNGSNCAEFIQAAARHCREWDE